MTHNFTVSKSAIYTETDYGGVVLNDRTGRYWKLNQTSATVFTNLRAGLHPRAIAVRLVEQFDGVTEATALADIEDVIREFRSAGLIR